MNVKIVKGPHTDENLKKCYHYIAMKIRKEIQRDSSLCKSINGRPSIKRIQS